MNPTLPWQAASKQSPPVHLHKSSSPLAPRSARWWWLLGLLLLTASAVGTGWVLKGSTTSTGTGAEPAIPPGIVCIGFVDVEPGIASLYPLQSGRVLSVRPEGTEVRKGDVLLRLDHELADYRVQEAQADLDAAKNVLEQARQLPQQYQHKEQQQQAAVVAANHRKTAAEKAHAIKAKLYNDKALVSLQAMEIAAELASSAAALAKVEESKLAELKQLDPHIDIRRAEAAVKAKEAQLDQAKFARRQCDLLAPADGMVLRVFVNPGEVLGPTPKQPALQFCPAAPRIIRAEVLQEWASRVENDLLVHVEDDTRAGTKWQGKVKSISPWYTQKRHIVLEPMVQNDVRTLECIVEIVDQDSQLRIGQRVRVTILPK